MSTQQKLLNTNGMSSAREMHRLRRERLVKHLGIKRSELPRNNEPVPENYEFNLPDEDKDILLALGACPICQHKVLATMRKENQQGGKSTYRIKCGSYFCTFETPAFPSSKQAKDHWYFVRNLSK